MFRELEDKLVLVVGSFQGIGKAVVTTFLAENAKVIAADVVYENADLKELEERLYTVKLDVSDEEQVEDLFTRLEDRGLVPDILVHVAGISTMDYLTESKSSDFQRNWEVNTRGFYLTAKHYTRLLKAKGKKGKVIVVDSQAGKNGYRAMAAYVASKHAVLGLVKTLALEVAEDKINVNAVCPGIIETGMKHRERIEGGKIRGLTPEEVQAEDNSQVPLGRTGTPQDVANVVLFLGSHLSDYMTGQAVNVTGGMTMN
ncbi:3-oxoacyl-[acyl-carrier protein] reductase [Liquorilactobacillus sucicola DSM 21376 = JCM 15457]|uniref:Short-chain dehydrogenase reductase sdr n=1 Tax=Liquorilactobacillus sucicola DSM 21376 = JCM 15457 TaxID=1423806 RepID=A0A023CYA4_9LACO|nr:SDR family NAD(P)-dependent oxidoreductase [Liquorilactobacillus sucicola]KRN07494.1 short-chain dehydrogenase reductase sdr [Liquorilactobacillus sucicola DSM 21376 = JCM 15457]GAJ26878.1 3-oxoacyl-[acyl-carrier protein] reductase [Liquorilactobacillus sucicola DSM 21376 = JCM 15457]